VIPAAPLPATVKTVGAKPVRSHHVMALCVKALLNGPQTTASIVRRTKIPIWTIRRAINVLHENECVHIAGWDARRCGTIAVYEMGKAPDVPKPPSTSTTRKRRRAAKKQSLDGWVGVRPGVSA